MNQDTHEVFVGGTTIELSPTEFKLLRYLRLNPNRVLSKAQILDHIWEYDFNGDAGIVESYISYLRRKVDAHSSEPLIQMMPAGLAEAGLTLLPTFLFDSQEEANYVCVRA
jgi:two-component system, OmpR family, response regulator